MFRKILVITLKVIITSVLIYSAFVILFISTFDLLSLTVYMSFKTFILEHIIPNISAVIALFFLLDIFGLLIRMIQILNSSLLHMLYV